MGVVLLQTKTNIEITINFPSLQIAPHHLKGLVPYSETLMPKMNDLEVTR